MLRKRWGRESRHGWGRELYGLESGGRGRVQLPPSVRKERSELTYWPRRSRSICMEGPDVKEVAEKLQVELDDLRQLIMEALRHNGLAKQHI